jgi:hypothetical protein
VTPDTPKFSHGQIVYHVTEDTPGVLLALVQYADCMRYKVAWQGRTTEEHTAAELTDTKPFFTTGDQSADD